MLIPLEGIHVGQIVQQPTEICVEFPQVRLTYKLHVTSEILISAGLELESHLRSHIIFVH